MEKMNEAFCLKNRVSSNGGGKQQVKKFKMKEFWKCIGCILLEVTYGDGAKYPNVLVSMTIRYYDEMFVEPPIYIRYVALTGSPQ